MKVDAATFGHATNNCTSPEIQKLSASHHKQLEQVGLLDLGDSGPNWEVHKKFYWRQTFQAHKSIHIRHQDTPVIGSENSIKYGLGASGAQESAKELQTFCNDGRLATVLGQITNSRDKNPPYFFVDFILTSGNTWKTPIEDFTLIVERPHQKGDLADYVSFCWDGQVTKIDADHFSAKATNFVPQRELKIEFFGVEKGRF
jgi:hypothetical protein